MRQSWTGLLQKLPPGRDDGQASLGTVTFLFTDIEGSTERWERDRTAMETAVEPVPLLTEHTRPPRSCPSSTRCRGRRRLPGGDSTGPRGRWRSDRSNRRTRCTGHERRGSSGCLPIHRDHQTRCSSTGWRCNSRPASCTAPLVSGSGISRACISYCSNPSSCRTVARCSCRRRPRPPVRAKPARSPVPFPPLRGGSAAASSRQRATL